jgi:hypothetical protein
MGTHWDCYNFLKKITNISKGGETIETLYVAGGNVKCYSHYDKCFGSSLKGRQGSGGSWLEASLGK